MVAILAGNTAVAETLIKAGANVYSLHSLGLTALHLAAKMGNVPIIDMLIDHGADVNISPPKAKGETPLMTAVWVGQIDAVKLLIEKGANVNAKMTTGEFALLWAAHKKHYEIFNILREAGAVE